MILIANGMAQLAEMPHLLARLRDKPRDIPAFVEEMARYKPPIHRLRRITTQEAEISGHVIRRDPTFGSLSLRRTAIRRSFPSRTSSTWTATPEGTLALGLECTRVLGRG